MKTFSKAIFKTSFILTLATVGLPSCRKLIEIPSTPPNQIPQSDIFTDSGNVMSAMAGVYNYNYNGWAFQDGNLSIFTGLSSDELSTSSTYNTALPQFYSNTLRADNDMVGVCWTSIYAGMYKVNVCLEGIGNSKDISASLKQQLLGELEVVRALYYFNLVNLYGGVPLVKTTDYQTTSVLPRATVDEVYAQIIADLTDARTKLTADYPSEGRARPNLYVASALLAKVYLYRGQWQQAYDLADQVIGTGIYHLETDLDRVFLSGSSEAIWQLPAITSYYQTTEASNYIPYSSDIVPNYIITDHLLNAFEPGDQRLTAWTNVNTVNTGTGDQDYYYPYKYKNRNNPAPTVEDFMILRLADLYLIRAEANAQLDHTTEAVDDLDEVRDRAGLSGSIAVTKEDVLAAIAHERQTELFSEWGSRWYDLKRTGQADAVLGSEKPGWKPTAALYPIPYKEVRSNVHLTQNPGY